jgi:pimeloyl-ACP methyl ester carboxylesterase
VSILRTVAVLSVLAAALPSQDPGLQRRIAVPLHDGRVHVGELLEAFGAAYGLDAGAVALPRPLVDLRGARGSLWLLGARAASLGALRFERSGEQLAVVVDRERARDVRRGLRRTVARLAGAAAGEPVAQRPVRFVLPAANDAAKPLVVLVHGIESGPAALDELRAFLADRGHQVAVVDWPNDAALDGVAAQVAGELRVLARQRVTLVGHSSGGLIARAIVENRALDPGNVDRVVLVGVPNGGSEVAALRALRECWNVAHDARDGGTVERDGGALARDWLAAVLLHWRDGLGEAGGDVLPGSVFLTKLAARERNPRVRYHAVLGTRSLLDREQHEALVRRTLRLVDRAELARVARPKLEQWLNGLDEWIDGEGDGAVSVAAGALPGVEPVLVPLDHRGLVRTRGVLSAPVAADEHPVFLRIADWLAAPR